MSNKRTYRSGKSTRGPLIFVVVATVILAGVVWIVYGNSESTEKVLEKANQALERQEYDEALRLSQTALGRSPDSAEALSIAAKASQILGDVDAAIAFYDQIPDDGSNLAIQARVAAGQLYTLKKIELTKGIDEFSRAFQQQPNSELINQFLAYHLGLSARLNDAAKHRLALIRIGRFDAWQLFRLGGAEKRPENPSQLRQFLAANPRDPSALVGTAFIELNNQRYEKAESLLRDAITADPQFVPAYVLLGQLQLLEPKESPADWEHNLPEKANEDPGIWAVRAAFAEQHNEIAGATRCYWETLRRDPNHQQACYRLGQLLSNDGKQSQATPFLERAERLESFEQIVQFAATGEKLSVVQNAAELAESLGLFWEASAWASLALHEDSHLTWAQNMLSRIRPRLPGLTLQRTVDELNPAQSLDLSALPLPDFDSEKYKSFGDEQLGAPPVTFEDVAKSVGISFQYINGGNPKQGLQKMFEWTGGGVAVLDFDCDGWPDIYFTQGSAWPPKRSSHEFLDRLYRNMGDGHFEDVTESAGLTENGFSQGVTVGDFNSDGFPDLYIANTDQNRLYQNSGDGKFTDVTQRSKTAGDRWTTSCVMADLSGDGLPDIYAVNYLTGPDVFTRVCHDDEGHVRTCHPSVFPASQDNFYLNLGNGEFQDATEQCGLMAKNGKGLGVVAADFRGTGRLDLFVANDSVANFFFIPQTSDTFVPRFDERALVSGLALNHDGEAEACMGVAAGDADGDGLLDLFVTNFFAESNTLYVQQSGGVFGDVTGASLLGEPSFLQLGFGTQFLDTDLDGNLDLIVTNGEIVRLPGREYQMKPQYFHNLGRGRFAEVSGPKIGSYFGRKYLGRSLARVDWNRDGLEDVVISHLDEPAALLANKTPNAGNSVSFKLSGAVSSRDAIGTTVVVKIGTQEIVRQLTAGDGYQASNERRIVFGLAQSTIIDSIRVRWPSGIQQEFLNLPAASEWLVVEGREELVRLDSLSETESR